MVIARLVTVVAAAAVLAAIPASAQSAPSRAPTAQRDGGQTLGPGDVIKLQIWREPDLSGEFQVDETGEVVLPKLGPMNVLHLSPAALKTKLVSGYERYLKQTSVDVTVLRRIKVLGAVKNPGIYPVDPTMTLGDAVALAGGPTPDGNSKKLRLVRDGKTLSLELSSGTPVVDAQARSGDALYVPERSWLSRHSFFLPALVSGAVTATVIWLRSRN